MAKKKVKDYFLMVSLEGVVIQIETEAPSIEEATQVSLDEVVNVVFKDGVEWLDGDLRVTGVFEKEG